MGNSCSCTNSNDNEDENGLSHRTHHSEGNQLNFEKNKQNKDENLTPRLMSKPEKLPSFRRDNDKLSAHKNVILQKSDRISVTNQRNDAQDISVNKQKDQHGNMQNPQLPFKVEEVKLIDKKASEIGVGSAAQQTNNPFSVKANDYLTLEKNIFKRTDNQQEPMKLQLYDQTSQENDQGKTLYQNLGQEMGLRQFSDLIVKKILDDPDLTTFFATYSQLELYRVKFRCYLKFLTGGQQFWIGKSLEEAHKHILINDNIFDKFLEHCKDSLNELDIKPPIPKESKQEALDLIASLRNQIVKKPEDVVLKKHLIDYLGGLQNLKKVAELTMDMILKSPVLNLYFKNADIGIHEKRLAYYFTYISGGQRDWIGKTLLQAHKGKCISEEHYDMVIQFIRISLKKTKVPEEYGEKLIDLVQGHKYDIVEDKQQMTLYEKLDINNRFEPVMKLFIEKMSKDERLGHFFVNNSKMMHCIPNKIMLFFAYSQGNMNPDDQQNIKHIHKLMKLNAGDFERSLILFKEALFENNIDPKLVEETLLFYKTMKKELVYDEETEEIMKRAEIFHQNQNSHILVHNNSSKDKKQQPFSSNQNSHPIPEHAQGMSDAMMSGCPFAAKFMNANHKEPNQETHQPENPVKELQPQQLIDKQNEEKDHHQKQIVEEINQTVDLEPVKELTMVHKIDQDSQMQKVKEEEKEVYEENKKSEEQKQMEEEQNTKILDQEKIISDKVTKEQEEEEKRQPIFETQQRENQNSDTNQAQVEKQDNENRIDCLKPEDYHPLYESENKGNLFQEMIEKEQQKDNDLLENDLNQQVNEDFNEQNNKLTKEKSQNKDLIEVLDSRNQDSEKQVLQFSQQHQEQEQFQGDHQRSIIESQIATPKPVFIYHLSELLKPKVLLQGEFLKIIEKQKTQVSKFFKLIDETCLVVYKDMISSKTFPDKPVLVIPFQEIKKISTRESTMKINSQYIEVVELELHQSLTQIQAQIGQLHSTSMQSQPQVKHVIKGPAKSTKVEDTVFVFGNPNKVETLKWYKELQLCIAKVSKKVNE